MSIDFGVTDRIHRSLVPGMVAVTDIVRFKRNAADVHAPFFTVSHFSSLVHMLVCACGKVYCSPNFVRLNQDEHSQEQLLRRMSPGRFDSRGHIPTLDRNSGRTMRSQLPFFS